MRGLRASVLCVLVLCGASVAWGEDATPAAEAPAVSTPPAAEAPAAPTDIVVVSTGSDDVTEEVLSQIRLATVAAASANQEWHGRRVRAERDPGIALRASNCPDDACLVATGQDAGGGFLFVLMLERAEVGYRVTVLLVDVAGGAMAGSAAFDLPDDPSAFIEAVREPLGPVLAAITSVYPQVGTVVVNVDQPGATISIDGNAVGVSPLEPIEEVEPGTRTVRVALDGYEVFEQTVEVVAGEQVEVTATLVPESAAPPPPPPTPIYRRWWFWTAIGAVVVGTGLGVGLGVGLSSGETQHVRYGVEFPTYEQR